MNATDLSRARTIRRSFTGYHLAVGLLLAAAGGCGAPPAPEEEQEPEATSREALVSEPAPEVAASAAPEVEAVNAAANTCIWVFNGKPLTAACAYFPPLPPFLYQKRWHSFAVGADSQVWHAWQITVGGTAYSNWTSLGGVARSQVTVFLPTDLSLYAKVLGTDGRNWCRTYNRPSARGKWDATWSHC